MVGGQGLAGQNVAMEVLVVHAHPAPESLSARLRDTAVSALERAGHHVEVVDLYAEDYDARMSREERLAYESESPIIDPMVARHASLLVAAEVIVFVYPTWYWGLPAILKGWLERTLVPGVGFVLDPRTNKVRGGLRGLRRVVGITTYGSRRVETFALADSGRRIVVRSVGLLAPALRCRATWLGLYGLNRCDPERIEAFVARVDRRLAAL